MGFVVVLCFLLIVLIAVISSEKIKKIVGNFFDGVIPVLFFWLGAVIVCFALYLFGCWGWNTWSGLDEIRREPVICILWITAFVILSWFVSKKINTKLKSRYGDEKVYKVYAVIRIVGENILQDIIALISIAPAGLAEAPRSRLPCQVVY